MINPGVHEVVSRFETTIEGIPPGIAEHATLKLADPDLTHKARVSLHAVLFVLGGGPTRKTRTADIANRIGTTEATLYRHVDKPFIDNYCSLGALTLQETFVKPRLQILANFGTELAENPTDNMADDVLAWVNGYWRIADPQVLYMPNPELTKTAPELHDKHAQVINESLSNIATTHSKRLPGTAARVLLPQIISTAITHLDYSQEPSHMTNMVLYLLKQPVNKE